jgi:transposase
MINFQIPLDIPDVEILKVEQNQSEDFIITVKSTKKSCRCYKCGNEATVSVQAPIRNKCKKTLYTKFFKAPLRKI